MAAHTNANPLLQLKEQVTCSVCLEVYKHPKSLTCHHAFCIVCIDRLPVDIAWGGEYQIRCPTCRELTVLQGDGSTDGLPPAFHVNAMVELYNTTVAGGPPTPPAAQDPDEPREDTTTTTYKKCPKHQQRSMEMFCEDCEEFICLECSIREHRNHEYDLANVIHPKYQAEVRDHLVGLKERVRVVAKAHEMLASRDGETADRGRVVKKRIDSYIQGIVERVQNCGIMLKEDVNALVLQQTERVSAQKNEVKNALDQLRDCEEYVEKELQIDVQHQMLKRKTELVEKMRAMTRERVRMEPPDRLGFLFYPNDGLVEKSSNLGAISSVMLPLTGGATGCRPRCSGKGATMALVGKETCFILHLSSKPNALPSCCLYNEDCGPLVPCQVDKTDTRRGPSSRKGDQNQAMYTVSCDTVSYTVSYTPTRVGIHHVKLDIEGVSTPCDPPTTIRVQTLPSPETRTKTVMGGAQVDRPWAIGVTEDNLCIVSEVGGKFSGGEPYITVRDEGGEVLSRVGEDQLYDPTGMAVTQDHHLLVADAGNHRVLKFTLEGELVAEGNKRLQILFSYPYGVASRGGVVYVSDSRHHCVHALHSIDLSFSHTIGKRGQEPGQFEHPCGLAVDSQDRLYVCDTGNLRIQRFSPTGEYIDEFGHDVLLAPFYMAIDCCDLVYVTDEKSCEVVVFDGEGGCVCRLGGRDRLAPRGIAVNSNGHIYICDYTSSKVIIYV